MPVVKRIRNRGATITVESHAEILFMPGGQVHNWANRFTGRIRAATIAAAPTNKRPRWDHYGKPLRTTIVSARPRFWGNGRDKMRVYGAVGSTAPHAYYVDQGTGVYAGNGPYEAKVLPPWARGDASLYEATWRPGGPGTRRVAPVMIKGQKGQFFFEEGLRAAFQSMRMRSFQVPGEPKISDAANAVATGIEGFLGNTPNNKAFRASLTEWRKWRDEAFSAGEGLNRSPFNARAKLREKAGEARRRKDALPDNVKAFLASKAAAERRKQAQIEALRKQREAKELGKKRAAEAKAKAANEVRKRIARAQAVKFAQSKIGKSPSGAWVIDPDTGLASGYRVTWITGKGNRKSRVFPV